MEVVVGEGADLDPGTTPWEQFRELSGTYSAVSGHGR